MLVIMINIEDGTMFTVVVNVMIIVDGSIRKVLIAREKNGEKV